MKCLRVTEYVEEINLEGSWGQLEAKKSFQRQSFTKFLRLTPCSCEIVHYRKTSISVFEDIFVSIKKLLILAQALDISLHTPLIFPKFLFS